MEDSVFANFDEFSSGKIEYSEERSNFLQNSNNNNSDAQLQRRECESTLIDKSRYNNNHHSKSNSYYSHAHQNGEFLDMSNSHDNSDEKDSIEAGSVMYKTISMIQHIEPSSLPSASPSRYEQTSIHEPLITHIPTLCSTANSGAGSNARECIYYDVKKNSEESNKVTCSKPNYTSDNTTNDVNRNTNCLNDKLEERIEDQGREQFQENFCRNKVKVKNAQLRMLDINDSDDDDELDKAFVNSAVTDKKRNAWPELHEEKKEVEVSLYEEQNHSFHRLPMSAKKEEPSANSFALSNTSIYNKPLVPNVNNSVKHVNSKHTHKHATHRRNHREITDTNASFPSSIATTNKTNSRKASSANDINRKESEESKSETFASKESNDHFANSVSVEAQEHLLKQNYSCKESNADSASTSRNVEYNYHHHHHHCHEESCHSSDNKCDSHSPQEQKLEDYHSAHSSSFSLLNASEPLQHSTTSHTQRENNEGNKYHFFNNTNDENSSVDSHSSDDSSRGSSVNTDDSGNNRESENEHSDLASNDNSVDESGHTAAERKFIDEFGFVIDEETKAKNEEYLRAIDGRQVARREVKWANMAADWENTNTKMFAKLKERCRKGIPARFRGVAWQLLLHSWHQMNLPENAGVYVALREKKLSDKEVDATIARDRARTFPNHVLFKDDDGVGQRFLCNVLHAYAASDPEVGYVQGMAFLVAALSTQMGEEECFWALHEMMYNRRYRMRELYKPGFPLLHQFFYQLKRLIRRLLPRLGERFEKLEVDPSFYASQWFLTLFVYHFSFRSLLRIWDIFFCEGWKIIFRTGIALMRWEEERLLSLPFDELLPALKNLQDGKNLKEVIRRAHRVKFKTSLLDRYALEYQRYVRTSHTGKGDVFKCTEYDYLEKLKDKLRPSWMN